MTASGSTITTGESDFEDNFKSAVNLISMANTANTPDCPDAVELEHEKTPVAGISFQRVNCCLSARSKLWDAR